MICIKIKRKFFNDQINAFLLFKCSGMMAPEDTWSNSVFAPIHRLTYAHFAAQACWVEDCIAVMDSSAAVTNTLNLLPTPQGDFSLTFHV